MALTLIGYIPFYTSSGKLICTVPYFNANRTFTTSDIPFDASFVKSKVSYETVSNEFGTLYNIPGSNCLALKPEYTLTGNYYNLDIGYYIDGQFIDYGICKYGGYKSAEDWGILVKFSNISAAIPAGIYPGENYIGFTYNAEQRDNPVVEINLVDYPYVYNKFEPSNPEDIEILIISPAREYAAKGQSIQFQGEYRYKDGTYQEAKDLTWEVPEEYASVTTNGLVTIKTELPHENPGVPVIATGSLYELYPKLRQTALIYVDSSAVYNPDVPPGSVQNPQNQYFPGGISGSSGVPQGSYDNSFGPNTSALIPGLSSTGESTGEGGAAGNDISNSGMYTKYLMNQGYLNVLAQLFWEDDLRIQFLKLMFGDPINAIISLISYPMDLTGLVPTKSQNIFFGKYDSSMPAQALTRSSFQIDWGTIPIDFYWGNFLDYAPYTQVHLFLPWGVGFVSIDPNEIMPYSDVPNDFNRANFKEGSIRVVTNIELDKGSCVHNVIGNRGLVIGSYGGIVGKQIPMTSLDQGAKTLALVGAATSVGVAAGNAMAGAVSGKYTSAIPRYSTVGSGSDKRVQTLFFDHKFEGGKMLSDMGNSGAARTSLASAAALFHTPPNYPRAGTFSDGTNAMCAQTPYIIISRPSQSMPQNYGHYNGYPSNIYYKKVAFVSGYTEFSEIHLDNIPGTVEELEELYSMLKGGVLL